MALIAVVDDETALIDLICELLADEGYDTCSHKVGATAYAMIQSKQPDLVVLDIRLETPDAGWLILELIRLDPKTTAIPVIVCSADTQFLKAKEEHLRKQGCCVLEKPFNLEDLLTTVATALDTTTKVCGPA